MSDFLEKQNQVPMIYRRHGDTRAKNRGHVLGQTFPQRKYSRELLDNDDANVLSQPSLVSPTASSMPFVPAFIVADKKVLRFDAYFLEAVAESETENFRVRRCIIYYYLEDDSMQIVEPKVENSGLPQGNFIKRHRIPKPEEESTETSVTFYDFRDLSIGENITCYGRTFRIVNLDQFTRTYLDERNVHIPASEEFPQDSFFSRMKAPPSPSTRHGKQTNSMKVFMEASLGKFSRPASHLKRFIDHDRHVLRWYAIWDDTSRLYGLKHRYTLHYFLADNTVEVRENFPRNSGCDPFPKLLNRTRLVKKPTLVSPHATDDSATPELEDEAYYSWSDFKLGDAINMYGRKLVLLDVDDSTREWFTQHGMDVGSPIIIDDSKPAPPPFVPPPHTTGIGSEEDSLASCFSLCPKPTKVMLDKEKRQLRFSAHMDSTKPEDIGRTFILTYFVKDAHITVMEPPVRNSGIVGGKFLEKAKHKRPDGAAFTPSEFFIGARVAICGHLFILNGVDEHTVKFMESQPSTYPVSDFTAVKRKVQEGMAIFPHRLQATIDDLNPKASYDIVKALCLLFAPTLVDHEINTIMRHYRAGGNDTILLQNLASELEADESLELGGGERLETASTQRVAMLLTRQRNVLLQNLRLQDAHLSGNVSRNDFMRVLRKMRISSLDAEVALEMLFSECQSIEYSQALSTLETLSM